MHVAVKMRVLIGMPADLADGPFRNAGMRNDSDRGCNTWVFHTLPPTNAGRFNLPVLTDEFAADTRTAVTFLFTSDADLFFLVRVVVVIRLVDNVGRRVLTFPSGPFVVLRELNAELLVGLGSGNLRGLVVFLVGRREDAKGHGNSGFKIQVDDL